ncbi:MAG: hypothetical protein QXQ41_01785 [Candidatus Bathyarchaeia archaeon]
MKKMPFRQNNYLSELTFKNLNHCLLISGCMLDELEEEELFDDFDEVPEVFDRAAEKWLDRNTGKAFHYILPTHGQPLLVVHEKQQVSSKEAKQILHYLKDEIVKRIDAYGRYNIKAKTRISFACSLCLYSNF